MHLQIKKLLEVQEKDLEILSLEDEKERLPLSLEKARKRLAAAEKALEEAGAGIKELKLRHKEMELESDTIRAAIEKYERQVPTIKSNAEYRALQKEIEDKKIENSRVEDRILEIMEQAEEKEKAGAECEREVTAAREWLQEEEKRISAESRRIGERIAKLAAERDSLLEGIDETLLAKYRRILQKKRGRAVVPLVDYACGGCHMRLPPNVMVNVKKWDHLVICENCSRILYWPEEVGQAAEAP